MNTKSNTPFSILILLAGALLVGFSMGRWLTPLAAWIGPVLQQAGWNDTGLMLVPSRDWFEIDPLHSHMAVFRAIENGMSIVRQTDEGLSLAADPYGRVLAQSDFFGTTDRTLVAQVPVKHVKTLYNLFGRWLEWLAPLGFVFVVGWALIGRRQMK